MKFLKTKLNFALLALLFTAMSFQALGQNNTQPLTKEVTISVSEAFIPGGFNSDSDVYVVVSGVFPNGCYQWSKAEVIHPEEKVHEVTSIATVTQGLCIMVLVPFSKEIRLGRFVSGEHIIRFKNGDGTFLEKTVTIE